MKPVKKHYFCLCAAITVSLICMVFIQACRRDQRPDTIILDLGGNTSMAFHLIPAGSFFMGCGPGEGQRAARPRHQVYLDAYYMGVTEVTNQQFSRFVDVTGYLTTVEQESRKGRLYGVYKDGDWIETRGVAWHTPEGEGSTIEDRMDHPAIHMSWYDADAFCRWLASHAGLKVCIPTEAQWEKAARAGDDTLVFPWGHEISGELANVEIPGVSRGGTVPVAAYPPNRFGLYDLGGNISEWTRDWYKKEYYGESPKKNPGGPETGQSKTRRGGHWKNNPDWECRVTSRRPYHPSRNNHYLVGFRCAIETE